MGDFALSGQLDTDVADFAAFYPNRQNERSSALMANMKMVNVEIFKDYIRVRTEDMTLLGAPILK